MASATAAKPVNVPTGTPWETALLDLLGAPATPANYRFLNEWSIREHGDYKLFANNPFFTSAGGAGSARDFPSGSFPLIPDAAFGPGRSNTAGIPAYPDVNTGVVATERTLEQYPSIAAALKSGNPAAFANDSGFQGALTTWSGHSYSDISSISAPTTPQGPGLNAPFEGVSAADITSSTGAGIVSGAAGAASGVASGIGGAVSSVTGAVTGVADAVKWPFEHNRILRAGEMLAGALFAIIGLLMLTRGLTIPAAASALKGTA